jgi:hypothetical protein
MHMRPSLDARKNAVDRRQSLTRLPQELEHHELEESREYRNRGNRNIDRSSERGSVLNTNRSRADSLIGKGSRYASPARAERRSPASSGGGGAITNNYYRNPSSSAQKMNNQYSEPTAPSNNSQNISGAGGQRPQPKEAPKFGDIQEFLNRLPAKTTA